MAEASYNSVQPQETDPSRPATTTFQQDLVTAGQRRINLVWEYTQAIIAGAVTFAYIASQLLKIESAGLANACFLIVGFYFSRTNHAAIGGVGVKPVPPYEGR
jgi:hypothetical protein